MVEAPPEGTVLLSGGYLGALRGLASRVGGLIPFFLGPTTEREALVRRIMIVVTVALVMAAMMVAMAMPAFAVANQNASPQGQQSSELNCLGGQFVAYFKTFDYKHVEQGYGCIKG